jgi:NAD(P)-dependent dehydrogenase (short-subunit alcohol dehydrogenase family)
MGLATTFESITMNRFSNKTVLVTGGTSGIGLATAQRLAQEGATVIVTGSRPQSIESARSVLGKQAHYLLNDAGKPAATADLVQAIKALTPQLDGVFFNAGFGRFAPLEAVTAPDFDEQFAVNVRGPLLQAQALSPLLAPGAALLLNTSIAREKGMATMAIYAATKGAWHSCQRGQPRAHCHIVF